MNPAAFLPLSLLLLLSPASAQALRPGPETSLTILADPGRFGTVERAAVAESLVDWRDSDPADDRACTTSFAATELRHFLALALAMPEDSIRLASPREQPSSGTVILLTSDPADARLAAVDTSGAPALGTSGESFRIFTDGHRPARLHVIEGRDRAGTLYGAYAFLNRLGVRFHGLGAHGTVMPRPHARLPQSLRVAEQPAFATRGFWAWEARGNREFFLWMARNRLNLWTAEERDIPLLRKLGIRLTEGGHHIQKTFLDPQAEYPFAVSPASGTVGRSADPYAPSPDFRGDRDGDGRVSYFEAHPEWYALIGNVRSPHIEWDSGDNYCTTNPDATHELVRNLISSLENGAWREADDVMFWMLDNGRWCTCQRCAAQGTPTDRLFAVLDSVAMALARERAAGRLKRPITLMPSAFLETMPPPSKPVRLRAGTDAIVLNWYPIDRCYVHALADSNCTEINQPFVAEYRAWATAPARTWQGPVGVGEYYNISSLKSLPVVLTHVIGADIPWYYRNGARHFHYMHVPTAAWGPLTLNHVVMARLLWDPEQPLESISSEYFRLYYPSTVRTMRSFYTHLETATANLKLLKHRVRVGRQIVQLIWQLRAGSDPLPTAHMHVNAYKPAQNDGPDLVEVMKASRAARADIGEALALRPSGDERARIAEDERRFSYCEATLEFFDALIQLYLVEQHGSVATAEARWRRLAASAGRLRGMTDVSSSAGQHANASDGLDATGLVDIYRAFERRYQGPK